MRVSLLPASHNRRSLARTVVAGEPRWQRNTQINSIANRSVINTLVLAQRERTLKDDCRVLLDKELALLHQLLPEFFRLLERNQGRLFERRSPQLVG